MYKKNFKFLLTIAIVLTFVVLWHNVSKKVTLEDQTSLQKIHPFKPVHSDSLSFEDQIKFISDFLISLHSNLQYKPIPFKTTREPSDLIKNNGGLCYDFSRTVEKFLIANEFETRHVFAFKKHKSNLISTLVQSKVISHALTEVKTKKGWMIVDSNTPWLGIDSSNNPVSFKHLNEVLRKKDQVIWLTQHHPEYKIYFKEECFFIYGFYSRHGNFYPPYSFIPDYNLQELLWYNSPLSD